MGKKGKGKPKGKGKGKGYGYTWYDDGSQNWTGDDSWIESQDQGYIGHDGQWYPNYPQQTMLPGGQQQQPLLNQQQPLINQQ